MQNIKFMPYMEKKLKIWRHDFMLQVFDIRIWSWSFQEPPVGNARTPGLVRDNFYANKIYRQITLPTNIVTSAKLL